MKKSYSKPEIKAERFSTEEIVTASGDVSAESKALNKLNDAGATQSVSVKWLY